MGGQFFSDEGRNHCPVDLLHDLSRGTSFVSHFSNLPYHFLNPSRRTHIIGGFLEGSCLRHKPAPFGDKRYVRNGSIPAGQDVPVRWSYPVLAKSNANRGQISAITTFRIHRTSVQICL